MADKKILSIPVDSTEFDELVKKIETYKATVKELPEHWIGQNAEILKASGHAETLSDNFEQAGKHGGKLGSVFDRFSRATSNPKMTGESSFISKFTRQSGDAEKSWTLISRDIEKSGKKLSDIARLAIIGGSRGGLFGAAAAAVGGVAGAVVGGAIASSNSLASQNADMRALGLKPGEQAAFETEYAKYGASDDTLREANFLKHNPGAAVALNGIGINKNQVDQLSTTELAQLMVQKGGEAFKSHDQNGMGGMWMKSMGLTDMLPFAQQASTYNSTDFDATRDEFAKLVPKLALAQDAYDKGTDSLKRFTAALEEDKTSLLEAFTPLLGPLSTLAKDFSDTVVAFAKSGEIKSDLDEISSGFSELAGGLKWVTDKLNVLGGGHVEHPAGTITTDNKPEPFHWDWSHPFGSVKHADNAGFWPWDKTPQQNQTDSASSNAGASSGDMDALLDATKYVESSNGRKLIGPMTKYGWQAKGAYQFSPDDLKRYGVRDPMDEREEREGARHKYQDLLKEYGGNQREATAAYEWGEGSVNDMVKHHGGKFNEADLPADVRGYLGKIDAAMNANPKDMTAEARKEYANTQRSYVSPVMADTHGGLPQMDTTNHFLGQIVGVLSNIRQELAGAFREGGGAAYRTPDAPRSPDRSSMPFTYVKPNVGITVFNQTGSSINVTNGSLAQ